MSEKIKKIVKNKYFKIVIVVLLWLFILRELYALYVDMYNFRQLEKAKIILEKIPEKDRKFYTLYDFNKRYWENINPIKNCYEMSNDNWKYPYIFWFKLESIIWILIYRKLYYTYPWYDLPINKMCAWISLWKPSKNQWCIENFLYRDFIETISNPCQD